MISDNKIVRIPNTPYRIEIWNGSQFPVALGTKVQLAHALSFPEEVPRAEGNFDVAEDFERFLDRVIFCHEPSECTWYLLWEHSGNVQGTSDNTQGTLDNTQGTSDNLQGGQTLVGLATTVLYTSSVYGFNLCVVPQRRGQGLGRRLMHQAQQQALEIGTSKINKIK
jgi:GNAT superfamily N-acetyltransferase